MFKTPLYIPEAKQPESFPRPGKIGRVEVKSYPSYRAAVVRSPSQQQNSMFRQLFRHIKDNKIAMTAPVEMTFDQDGQESMAFLYANPTIGKAGWEGEVEVIDVPATEVLSVAIRGAYRQDRFEAQLERLQAWLNEHPKWRAAGKPRYMGFNSPFIPSFFRLGEVQIRVTRQLISESR